MDKLRTAIVTQCMVMLVSTLVQASSSNLQHVTCGSVVKLMNNNYKTRLHSHDIKYGSGSGQQSVTAVDDQEDGNSYWAVKGNSHTHTNAAREC